MSALLVQLLCTAFALAVPATASLFVHQPVRPRVRAGYRVLLAGGLVAGAALVGGARRRGRKPTPTKGAH